MTRRDTICTQHSRALATVAMFGAGHSGNKAVILRNSMIRKLRGKLLNYYTL